MNSLGREMSLSVHPEIMPAATCAKILERVKALPDHFWFRRTGKMMGRGYPGETCEYWFASHYTLPKEFVEELREVAPKYPTWNLDQICINKYMPGDFIGKHKDRGEHPFNLVIALQDGEDGILLHTGELLKDKAGTGVLNAYTGYPHSVPPVSSERYVLIYLYEEFFDGEAQRK